MKHRVTSAIFCLLVLLASVNVTGTPEAVSKEEPAAVSPDTVQISVTELIAAAEQGDPKARIHLGDYYIYGQEKESYDESLAREGLKCYLQAAMQGLAHGQLLLGFHFWKGYGVKWNPYEAVKWFELAAEQGHPAAQCKLALAYGGLGVNPDPGKAHA